MVVALLHEYAELFTGADAILEFYLRRHRQNLPVEPAADFAGGIQRQILPLADSAGRLNDMRWSLQLSFQCFRIHANMSLSPFFGPYPAHFPLLPLISSTMQLAVP